jgi:uncharacterized membrane protein
MEWISEIGSLFLGGGWGTFAAVIAASVLIWFLYRMYKDAQYKKAENDTKEKSAEDEAQEFEKNKKLEEQMKEDEKKSEEEFKKSDDSP